MGSTIGNGACQSADAGTTPAGISRTERAGRPCLPQQTAGVVMSPSHEAIASSCRPTPRSMRQWRPTLHGDTGLRLGLKIRSCSPAKAGSIPAACAGAGCRSQIHWSLDPGLRRGTGVQWMIKEVRVLLLGNRTIIVFLRRQEPRRHHTAQPPWAPAFAEALGGLGRGRLKIERAALTGGPLRIRSRARPRRRPDRARPCVRRGAPICLPEGACAASPA